MASKARPWSVELLYLTAMVLSRDASYIYFGEQGMTAECRIIISHGYDLEQGCKLYIF
jgi:hypothetical protein